MNIEQEAEEAVKELLKKPNISTMSAEELLRNWEDLLIKVIREEIRIRLRGGLE